MIDCGVTTASSGRRSAPPLRPSVRASTSDSWVPCWSRRRKPPMNDFAERLGHVIRAGLEPVLERAGFTRPPWRLTLFRRHSSSHRVDVTAVVNRREGGFTLRLGVNFPRVSKVSQWALQGQLVHCLETI